MPARFAPDLLLVVLLPLAAPALAQVSVQEYAIPRGHYAHDVWADAAPGGPVWFSAQRGGELGILDPASGKVEFVPLGPGSAPHGVIAGADGAPWLTDGGQNAIVRVDPKTRQVKAWPLPEGSGYANLNTATFDRNGVQWFTGQSGIYGRLDPRSGELMPRFDPASEKFDTFKSSSPNANVRQIHGRKGEVWTPESAADKIVVYRYR